MLSYCLLFRVRIHLNVFVPTTYTHAHTQLLCAYAHFTYFDQKIGKKEMGKKIAEKKALQA